MRYAAKGRKRICGHSSKARLHAKVATKRCGNAHAARPIRANAEWPHAGSHSSGRAATRSTRRFGRIPRIARHARARRIRLAFAAEFWRGGLAKNYCAGFSQTRRGWSINLPRLICIHRMTAAKRRHALREDDVFDRSGHTFERAHSSATLAMFNPLRFTFDSTLRRFLAGDMAKSLQNRVV